MEKILFSWSGGKDSALALFELKLIAGQFEIAALLTTVTDGYERISMRGVRRQLLHAQSLSLSIPVEEVRIPVNANNEIYENQTAKAIEKYKAVGVSKIAFGDLFLEEIRKYREISRKPRDGVHLSDLGKR